MGEAKKVPLNQAIEETEKWLDFKKITSKSREDNEDAVETIAEYISEGILSINKDNFEITHNLIDPITNTKGEISQSQLVYKPRLRVKETLPHLKGVKSGDSDGRVLAYFAAITNLSKNVLRELDMQDYSIGQQIVVFFF